MFYRESEDGRMLEEGIIEAGAFSAWLALATAYSSHELDDPFYIHTPVWFSRIHDLAGLLVIQEQKVSCWVQLLEEQL